MSATSTRQPEHPTPTPQPKRSRWIDFDVHGAARIRVDPRAPTAAQMTQMFAPFRCGPHTEPPDIWVGEGSGPPSAAARAEHDYLYTEEVLYLNEPRVRVSRRDDGFAVSGQRELLTYVLPILDWVLCRRDVAMIHAATFTYQGVGVAMPAWGGVGKTSMMARLAQTDETAVMGDDWAFLGGDGTLYGYAKPMYIKPHHRNLYAHLFDGVRKPLVPSRLSKPLSKLATLAHPAMTRFPRFASMTRRWSPEHLTVTPEQALPDARFARSAPLGVAVFVERTDADMVRMEPKPTEWMVHRTIGNFHAELPQQSRDLLTALGATGIVPSERFFTRKAQIVRDALDGIPCHLLQVPAAQTADTAAGTIVDRLLSVAGSPGAPS